MSDFPWNGDPTVDRFYENNDNYKVINTGNNTGRAIVFFSGNGLFYPNEISVFENVIIKKDRYEWGRIGYCKTVTKHYQLVVFVRDIYKQWYVTGINKKADTVDKTADLLAKLLSGMEVTTVGVSAGGYAAVLFGKKLNAKRVFTISGQFLLKIRDNDPFITKYSNDESRSVYYDLKKVLDDEFAKRIYYFYPSKSEEDILQNDHVRDYPMTRFAIDTETHGALLRYETFYHLFTVSDERLKKSSRKHEGTAVGGGVIFDDLVPILFQIKYRFLHFGRILLHKE